MDLNSVLITIFTAIVGWSLNELSQFFKYKREDKRLVNKALFSLIELHSILARLEEALKSASESPRLLPPTKDIINMTINESKLDSKFLLSKLEEAYLSISEVDPLVAQDIRDVINKSSSFGKEIDDYLGNEVQIAHNYKHVERMKKETDRFIRKVSFRKSKITWLRYNFRKFFPSKKKALWKETKEFLMDKESKET